MADTVVDSLVVTLGLKSEGFTEGQEKARAEIARTKDALGRAADSMGDSFGMLAGKISMLFLGFAGLAGVVDLLASTAEGLKEVAIQSRVLGVSAHELRSWQEASQLAGGGPNDMANYIGNLNKSLFALRYNGQWSSLFTGFERAGIDFQSSNGLAKDPHALMLEVAQYLARVYPGNTPQAREMRATAAEVQFGLPQSMAYMVSNLATFDREWNKSAATNQGVTMTRAQAAKHLVNEMIDLKFKVQDIAAKAFPTLDKWTVELFKAFKELAKVYVPMVEEAFKTVAKDIDAVSSWFKTKTGHGPLTTARHMLETPLKPAAAEFQKNKLEGLALGAMAIAQLPMNPVTYILSKIFDDSHSAISPTKAAGDAVATVAAAGAIGKGSATVVIGSMTINTKATDANGIARDMHSALKRKFLAGQADNGVTP